MTSSLLNISGKYLFSIFCWQSVVDKITFLWKKQIEEVIFVLKNWGIQVELWVEESVLQNRTTSLSISHNFLFHLD